MCVLQAPNQACYLCCMLAGCHNRQTKQAVVNTHLHRTHRMSLGCSSLPKATLPLFPADTSD